MVELISVVVLYKKYHRNFVKQFRKGTRFKFKNPDNSFIIDEAIGEPYYLDGGIYVTGTEDWWVLVYSEGQLADSYLNIEENVV